MDYYEVINHRRMVRTFVEDPLDPNTVDRIVTAGLQGPSAGFSQGFEFLVCDTATQRERFWETNEHNPQPAEVRRAPLVIVPFASKQAYLERYAEPDKGWTDRDEERWPVPYWYIDTGFAALHILLAAVAEGLGALFFGIPRDDWPSLRSAFSVPPEYDPIGTIVIGKAGDDRVEGSAATRERKDLGEVVHRGEWGHPYN